jgi:hypothetical protein
VMLANSLPIKPVRVSILALHVLLYIGNLLDGWICNQRSAMTSAMDCYSF